MRYEQKETVFDAGAAALFYSDGLVEAHDPKGEMFGFPGLRSLIAEHDEGERSLGDSLMEKLYSFVGAGGRHNPPYPTTFLSRTSENPS